MEQDPVQGLEGSIPSPQVGPHLGLSLLGLAVFREKGATPRMTRKLGIKLVSTWKFSAGLMVTWRLDIGLAVVGRGKQRTSEGDKVNAD